MDIFRHLVLEIDSSFNIHRLVVNEVVAWVNKIRKAINSKAHNYQANHGQLFQHVYRESGTKVQITFPYLHFPTNRMNECAKSLFNSIMLLPGDHRRFVHSITYPSEALPSDEFDIFCDGSLAVMDRVKFPRDIALLPVCPSKEKLCVTVALLSSLEPSMDAPECMRIDWTKTGGLDTDAPVFEGPHNLFCSVALSDKVEDCPGYSLILRCCFLVTKPRCGKGTNTLAVRVMGQSGTKEWRLYPATVKGGRIDSPFFGSFQGQVHYEWDEGIRSYNWGTVLARTPLFVVADLGMAPAYKHDDGQTYSDFLIGPVTDGHHTPITSYLNHETSIYNYSSEPYINMFGGIRMNHLPFEEPTVEKLAPLLALIFVDVCGENRAAFSILLRFLALKLQQPCTPAFRLLTLFSTQQGVGKNLLLNAFGEQLIGPPHYTRIRSSELVGRFNDVLENKLLIHCDEFTAEGNGELQRLKDLVTDTKMKTEAKYQTARESTSFTTYTLTMNHAFPLEPNDRRTIVIECTNRLSAFDRGDYGIYTDNASSVYKKMMPLFGHFLLRVPVDHSVLRSEYLPSHAWDICRELSLPPPIRSFIESVRARHTVSSSDKFNCVFDPACRTWATCVPSKLWKFNYNWGDPRVVKMFRDLGVHQDGEMISIESHTSVMARVRNLLPLWGTVAPHPTPSAPVIRPTKKQPFDEKILYWIEHAQELYDLVGQKSAKKKSRRVVDNMEE